MINAGQILQLRIALSDIEPPIWRRVRVAADLPLRRLHDVIQAVFGWRDYHLHQFEVGDKVYGQTEIEALVAADRQMFSDKNIRLDALVARGVQRFVYRYDFGDDWEHLVTIEEMMDPEPRTEYPVLVNGARAAPPEDCGGVPGFLNFLEAMRDEDHEDHDDLLDWYGKPFDPDDLKPAAVEVRLRRIRASRRKGPAKGSRATPRSVSEKQS